MTKLLKRVKIQYDVNIHMLIPIQVPSLELANINKISKVNWFDDLFIKKLYVHKV